MYFINKGMYYHCFFRVEWLVIDESDKLFEDGKTGFRDQVHFAIKILCIKNLMQSFISF